MAMNRDQLFLRAQALKRLVRNAKTEEKKLDSWCRLVRATAQLEQANRAARENFRSVISRGFCA